MPTAACFLICDTHAEPQEITDREPVDQKVFTEWDSCIRSLLATYRFRGDPVTITPSPGARKLLDAYYNELVRRRRTGGDLHDVNGYAARWCENAWRISTIWHVINEGADAPNRELSEQNAEGAIELVRWFVQEQLAVLAGLRSQQRQARMDKLSAILIDRPEWRCTLRELRKNHGFHEAELRSLAAVYPHRLEIRSIKPTTGRPSEIAILKK